MKDLYSFHADKEDLERFFNKVLQAYDKIYKRCGLKAIKSEAAGGCLLKKKPMNSKSCQNREKIE